MRGLGKLALFGALTPGASHALNVPTTEALMEDVGWSHSAKVQTKGVGVVGIEKRVIAGNPCYRAVAKAQVPMERLLEVVADVEAEPDYLKEGPTLSKLLASQGSEAVFVQYLDMPGWTMMADRFWFARSNIQRGAGEVWLTWEGVTDPATEFPKEFDEMRRKYPKALQPELNIGGWAFRDDGGTTHMQYTLCTDVGGRVPQWIQNSATRSTLPGVIRDVIKEALRREGQVSSK